MFENIRLSFQGIWSHKMRSFLTMLGIIIGIAAIIAIVSTIQGTNEQIKQNMMGNNSHTVKVQLTQDDMVYEISDWMGSPDGIPVYTSETRDEILKIANVLNAAFYNVRSEYNQNVFYGSLSVSSCKVLGVDLNYFTVAGYQMQKGRSFIQSDLDKKRQVVIVDETIARTLFENEDPVGKSIEIHGEPFTVIGVCGEMDTYEPVINSIDDYYTYNQYQNSTGLLFVPSSAWPVIYSFDEAQNLIIKTSGTEEMAAAGKAAADILNLGVSNANGIKYKSEDLMKQAKDLQDLQNSTNSMLIWIAGISLLVGGIGVMNIMLVTVTERTREIGLKKAIGARKGRILAQFLTEAAILTSLGGIIGVLAGTGLAQIISKMSDVPVAISVPAIVVSVGFSTLIGLIFGLLPSVQAANLNPIDALRHE